MKKVDVCLTPELLHLHNLHDTVVVVVDILRATSTIATGMANGVESFIPVARLEQCAAFKKLGYITAAERDGKKAEGFDLGNSPFEFMKPELRGRKIVITTTNGTEAIKKSHAASEIIIGSFLNKSAVSRYLAMSGKDVLILCAGWKGNINIEDTIYAGSLVDDLSKAFQYESDPALMALELFDRAKADMLSFLLNSSHVRRLNKLNIFDDIQFCLKTDEYDVVPVLRGESLVRA